MQQVLPRIYQETTDFKIKTLDPMVGLGGDIKSFAKKVAEYLRLLSRYITNMRKLPVNSPEYSNEKAGAEQTLAILQKHAVEVQAKCQKTSIELHAVSIPPS
jgi:hypothetical protein